MVVPAAEILAQAVLAGQVDLVPEDPEAPAAPEVLVEVVAALDVLEGDAGPRPGSRAGQHFAEIFGKNSAKCCSFSAVSAPIFSRKYAFCSIFQKLPDSQAEFF